MAQGITIIGLGTGDIGELTIRAFKALQAADAVVVVYPADAELLREINPDLAIEMLDAPEAVIGVEQQLVKLARRQEGVVYATAGNPLIDDAVTQVLVEGADELDLDVAIIPGTCLLDDDIVDAGLDSMWGFQVCHAAVLETLYHPPLDPDVGALVVGVHAGNAEDTAATLLNQYHGDHPAHLLSSVREVRLDELAEEIGNGAETVYLPPLGKPGSISSYQNVMAQLRAPGGCPWDAEQTHETLRTHLLEETYEVLAALDAGDTDELKEELGDLLLQILFHAQIGAEKGEFKLIDTIQYVVAKLIRRHPHVFGNAQVDDAGEVLVNWEQIKRQERRQDGAEQEFKSMLSGINRALPSLARAIEVQRRVARVGFDWPDIAPVRAKVAEEMAELEAAQSAGDRAAEFGDLIFALVNLGRWLDIDAESAARGAIDKFERRFEAIERHAAGRGVPLETMTLEQMDAVWDEVKAREQSAKG